MRFEFHETMFVVVQEKLAENSVREFKAECLLSWKLTCISSSPVCEQDQTRPPSGKQGPLTNAACRSSSAAAAAASTLSLTRRLSSSSPSLVYQASLSSGHDAVAFEFRSRHRRRRDTANEAALFTERPLPHSSQPANGPICGRKQL